MDSWLRDLPKLELHVHLDGSLRPSTVRDLAKKLPRDRRFPRGFDPCKAVIPPDGGSLEAYLETFQVTLRLLQDEPALERVAYEFCEDAAAENVIYVEIRFAPLLHTETGLKPRDVVTSVLAGMRRAEADHPIRAGLILTALKQESTERSMEVAQLAAQFAGKGVVAFDLAGSERLYPPRLHRAAVDFAHAAGVHLTIHAGEACCPEQIREAVDLGAERIGHGVHLFEDPRTEARVRKLSLPLEICPTSNLQTSSTIDSYAEHPLKRYLDLGIPISINTDNRLMTQTDLTREYESIVEAFSLGRGTVHRILLDAAGAAFCSEELRTSLRERIGAAFTV
ncbi:adenosine deaminase [Candidatus Bipolaricaulota bacterium]